MSKNTTSEYDVKRTKSGPIYFRARWLKSRKLKSRPSNKTLTQAWLIKS